MCGIVGVAVKAKNGFCNKTQDSFYQMLLVDSVRGEDSTGVVFVENDSSFGIMKEASPSWYTETAFKSSTIGKAMWNMGKAMIGHNRKQTSGKISDRNAHPFVVNDSFAMVHNGTLYGHKDLADTEVDSEALAIHLSKVLNKDLTKEKLEEALGKVYGAYAIAAYNKDTNSIYLTRNKDRPLSYVETPEGVFWASEYMMLYWILSRNGIDVSKTAPQTLKEDTLLTINLEDNSVTLMEYVPKKATPPAKQVGYFRTYQNPPTHVGKARGASGLSNVEISKNAFKRIKHTWIGKDMTFFVDDFVEKNFPRTIAQGETEVIILGESDSFYFPHTVRAEINILNFAPEDYAITDSLYRGTVADATYDKVTGSITFIMGATQKVPTSYKATNENLIALH